MKFLSLGNVNKIYHSDVGDYQALKNVSFELDNSEFVVILGPSGAGKTCLLKCAVFGSVANMRWYGYVATSIITFIFAVIATLILRRKITRVDMNGSLKIIE